MAGSALESAARPRPRVAGAVAAFAALGVFYGALGVLLPDLKEATGASDGALGLALFVGIAGALPAMLLVGPVADRHGQRAVAAALLAFGAVAVVPGLASSPLLLAAGLVLCGAASGTLDVTMNAAVSAYEADGRRLMPVAHAVFSVGLLVGSVGVGLARDAGAGPLGILAVVGGVLAATATLNLGPPPERPPAAKPARAHLSRALLVIGLLCAVAFLVESGLQSWSAIHLEETLGASPSTAGIGLGLHAAAMVVGRLFAQRAGALGDAPLLVISGLVGAGGVTLLALAPGTALALAGLVVSGFGISIAAPILFSLGGHAVPEARGAAISTVLVVAYGGLMVGPLLVGQIADAVGLRAGMLALAAAAGALALGAPAVRRRG